MSDGVRVEQSGRELVVRWGPEASGRAGPLLGSAAVGTLVGVLGLAAAGSIEEGGNMAMANVVGVTAVAVLIVVIALVGLAMVRSKAFHRKGELTVTPDGVEAAFARDPYATLRMNSTATDDYPQFRQRIDRDLIASVYAYEGGIATRPSVGRPHEIRAVSKSGVEYVLGTQLKRDEAESVVELLRLQLELPKHEEKPASARAKTRKEQADAAALEELHDAVSEYRQGPVILPDAEPQRERD